MVDWYVVAECEWLGPNFGQSEYIDMNGYTEGTMGSQDIQTHGEAGDPFLAYGIDTENWTFGQAQMEIGLLESHRIRITSSGVYVWTAGDVWEDILGLGGASNLGELGDVEIDGTPADHELLAWDDGSSKWINMTAAEAGLESHTEDHDNTHHTTNYHTEADGTGVVTVHSGITDAGSGIIISTGERNNLHTIYSLESHNNTYHSTNYEEANANIQSHVASPATDAHHTATVAGDLNLNDLAEKNHASLDNKNSETDIKHLTDAQLGDLHSDVIVSVANVESVITTELEEGESIDNRIDSLISAIDHDATKIKGITVDDTDIGNNKILKYNSGSGNLEYEIDDTGAGFAPPIGFIAMFSGAWTDNSTIPGWYKCDGNNGTVDLVDKFVRGAATSGGSGGSDDAILVSHNHGVNNCSNNLGSTVGAYARGNNTYVNQLVNTEGVSGTNKNIPAYYALIFIQRIS